MAVLVSVVVWAVAGAATRSVISGALVASAFIGVLWVKSLVASVRDLVASRGLVAMVLLALVGVAAVLAIRLMRRRGGRLDADRLTVILNRASLLLVVASLIAGFANGHLRAVVDDLDQGVGLSDWPMDQGASPGDQPDIYVILLDGYPRADVLEYAFGWDNSPFVDALAERGLDVAAESHSDYLWTHLSLPSALNLAYVEQIATMREVMEGEAARQPALRMTITDNVAFRVAREHRYTVAAVGAGFEELAARRADVYIDGGQMNEFELTLLATTFAGDAVNGLAPRFAAANHADRITESLAVLPRVAGISERGPALVFAHVPAPHQPAVLDGEDGTFPVPITPSFYADSPGERGEDADEFKERYRRQLGALNARILAAIDGITAASRIPPVIVLFADHGSASVVDWTTTSVEAAEPARLLERTGTLFAARTPGRTDVFPEDISPVDLFRLLFDAYFNTEYGRAEPPENGGQVAVPDASVLDD